MENSGWAEGKGQTWPAALKLNQQESSPCFYMLKSHKYSLQVWGQIGFLVTLITKIKDLQGLLIIHSYSCSPAVIGSRLPWRFHLGRSRVEAAGETRLLRQVLVITAAGGGRWTNFSSRFQETLDAWFECVNKRNDMSEEDGRRALRSGPWPRLAIVYLEISIKRSPSPRRGWILWILQKGEILAWLMRRDGAVSPQDGVN